AWRCPIVQTSVLVLRLRQRTLWTRQLTESSQPHTQPSQPAHTLATKGVGREGTRSTRRPSRFLSSSLLIGWHDYTPRLLNLVITSGGEVGHFWWITQHFGGEVGAVMCASWLANICLLDCMYASRLVLRYTAPMPEC